MGTGASGRKKAIYGIPLVDIISDLTPEEKEKYERIKRGRKDPVSFAEESLGLELHDGEKVWIWITTGTQHDKCFELGLILNSPHRHTWDNREEFDAILERSGDFLRNILIPSNRWGKTLVTTVKHLWYDYYKIGVRGDPSQVAEVRCGTLNLSPHSNQCQAGYDYVKSILGSQMVWTVSDPVTGLAVTKRNECKIPEFFASENSQKRTISFANGSFYKAIPTGEDQASSLAGSPYLYISYDECAQSIHLKAELPAKIMSRCIDYGAPVDLVSTPEVDKPSHQYFFHIAKQGMKGEEGWFTFVGNIWDNKFLGKKEVDKIVGSIKATDPIKYRQVAYGEFVTTGKKMFDAVVIERIWDEYRQPLPITGHDYILWADWGFADTGDPTVFYVVDYTTPGKYRIVFREAIRGGSPFTVLARARILQREWNGSKFGHDSSAMGGVMIKKMLLEMGMVGVIDFSAIGDKAEMLFLLQAALTEGRRAELDEEGNVIEKNPDFGRIRGIYIPDLEEQLGNYQYNPDKGVTDKRIEQDDVMCLGMIIHYLEKIRMKSKTRIGPVNFNPLADTAEKMFDPNDKNTIKLKVINVPEKVIL